MFRPSAAVTLGLLLCCSVCSAQSPLLTSNATTVATTHATNATTATRTEAATQPLTAQPTSASTLLATQAPTAPPTVSSTPIPTDACLNTADIVLLASAAFETALDVCLVQSGFEDITFPDLPACLHTSVNMSLPCARCPQGLLQCTMQSCMPQCQQGASVACIECQFAACNDDWVKCAGQDLDLPRAACNNPSDNAIVDSDAFDMALDACVIEAGLGDWDFPPLTACMQNKTELSDDCAECSRRRTSCTFHKCLEECAVDTRTDKCRRCVQSGCTDVWNDCAGLQLSAPTATSTHAPTSPCLDCLSPASTLSLPHWMVATLAASAVFVL